MEQEQKECIKHSSGQKDDALKKRREKLWKAVRTGQWSGRQRHPGATILKVGYLIMTTQYSESEGTFSRVT